MMKDGKNNLGVFRKIKFKKQEKKIIWNKKDKYHK